MPLLLVLILVLIAFGLLLVGFLTSSVLWAWVSVLVSAAAAVVLVVDTLQRRSAVRAGDTGGIPTQAAAGDTSTELPTAFAARPVSPPAGRPSPNDPVTEVIPVVRGPRAPAQAPFPAPADAERTIVMPVVQPSGSPTGPSGAASGVTPSRDFSSPSVTNSDTGSPTSVVPAATSAPDLVKRGGPAADAPGDADGPPPATVAVPSGSSAGLPDGSPPPSAEATAVVPAAHQPAADQRPVERPTAEESSGDRADAAAPSASEDRSAAEATSVVAVGGATSGGDEPVRPSGPDLLGASGGTGSAEQPSGSAPADAAEPPARVEEPAAEEQPASAGGEPPEEARDEQAAALVARLDDEVLVVDEQPRYHVPGCRAVVAAPLIPLPAREAVELGFTPCGWCTPDRTLAGRHAPARS